jgi:hypothetical protein
MRSERVIAATGALYVVAIGVGDPLSTSTGGDGSLLDHLREGRSPVQATGVVLELLGFGLFLVFVGYLYRVLRRAERPGGWAAAAAFGVGLVTAAIKLGSAAPVVASTYRAHELTPALARTLDDLNGGAFVVSGYTFGIFTAIAAGSAFGSRVLPRWLSISGLVLGTLTLVAGIAGILDPAGYVPVPFLLSLVWLGVTSIVLAVRGPRAVTGPADRADDAVPAEVAASA